MKILKWVVGVPVGLFVVAFVLFAIFHMSKPETAMQRAYKDCQSDAKALYRSNPAQAGMAYQQCEILNR